jgi:hypothetical protein
VIGLVTIAPSTTSTKRADVRSIDIGAPSMPNCAEVTSEAFSLAHLRGRDPLAHRADSAPRNRLRKIRSKDNGQGLFWMIA